MAMPEAKMEEKVPSLEEAKVWLEVMGDRGIINSNSARLRSTAIDALATILGDDEPRTVEYMLTNLDAITARWTTRNNGNPETAGTYRTRTKGALEDFLAYRKDPTSFKPKAKTPSADGSKKAEKRAEARPAAAATTPPPSSQPERSYPLADGSEFFYRLPEKGLAVRDVLRIACHLITMTKDFDPSNQAHASVFALARVEDK